MMRSMREAYLRKRNPYARRRAAGGVVAVLILVSTAFVGLVFLRWVSIPVLRPKPTQVVIVTDPADSTLRFGRFRACAGRFAATGIKPGTYSVGVARKGFVTLNESIRLSTGQSLARTLRLRPLLYPLTVATKPDGVRLEVRTSRDGVRRGRTPFSRKVPSGSTRLRLEARGYNSVTESFFHDRPRKFEIWMDPKGLLHRCRQVFGCGPSPKQVAFSPDGKELWVSTMGATGVEIYYPRTGRRIGRVDMGPNGAVEVTFARDGETVYASQMQTASVFRIDRRSRRVGRRFPTNSAWTKVMALSPDQRRLYAANWSGNDISEIDLKTGKVRRRLPAVGTPRGLYVTPDGRRLFVAGFERGELQRINLRNGKSKVLMKSGGALRHLVADEKRGILYADDMAADRVYAVNLKTERVRTLAQTDEKPNTIDLTPDGRVLYVSCRGENNSQSYYVPGPEWGSVLAIDTSSGRVLDAIVGGNQCTGLDVSADGKYLAFSDFLDARIHVYSIPPYRVLAAGHGGRAKAHLAEIRKT